MTLRRALFAGIAACALLMIGHLMMAQGQGRPDPAQMQQMMMDRIKTQTGLADADWDALKPKVQAVMEKRLPTLSGMRYGGGRPGGDAAGGGGQRKGGGTAGGGFSSMFGPQMEELNALRDALSEGGSEADIKTKMDAFVDAYKKRQEELKKAQEELAAAAGDKVKVKAALMINGLIPVS